MKLLYTNTFVCRFDGRLSHIYIETDGELLYVTVGPEKYTTLEPEDMELYVTYNGLEADMSSYPFRERTVTFPYSGEVKSLSITDADGQVYNYTWAGGLYDPTPFAGVSFTGFRHYDKYKITYTCEPISGHTVGLIGIVTHIWSEERQTWYSGSQSFNCDTSGVYADQLGSSEDYWDKCRFDLYFGAYKDGVDGYVGVYKHTSPEFLVVGSSSPYAPHNLTCESIKAGGSGEIYWSRLYDSKHLSVYYELQRSVNDGDFEQIYRGQDNEYTDTLPEDVVTVIYRVRATNGSYASDWCVGECQSAALCNVYVCVDGEMRPASAVYIGINGVPTPTTSLFEVG